MAVWNGKQEWITPRWRWHRSNATGNVNSSNGCRSITILARCARSAIRFATWRQWTVAVWGCWIHLALRRFDGLQTGRENQTDCWWSLWMIFQPYVICSLQRTCSELHTEQGSRVLTVQSNGPENSVGCRRSFGPAWLERFSFVLIYRWVLWAKSAKIHDDQEMLLHRFGLRLSLVNSQSSKRGTFNRHFGENWIGTYRW